MVKYNINLSDYNSEQQKSDDVRRIGNAIYNKRGSNDADCKAWERYKEYVRKLENYLRVD